MSIFGKIIAMLADQGETYQDHLRTKRYSVIVHRKDVNHVMLYNF